MGGSVAVMSAATLPGIDAAVNLSGPVEWGAVLPLAADVQR